MAQLTGMNREACAFTQTDTQHTKPQLGITDIVSRNYTLQLFTCDYKTISISATAYSLNISDTISMSHEAKLVSIDK